MQGFFEDWSSQENREVAVKMMPSDCDLFARPNCAREIIKEVNLMASLGVHPNVVRLIARCTTGTSKGNFNIIRVNL